MIEVCGLWTQKSARGTIYHGGTSGKLRYYVLPNAHKKSARDPDFHLLLGARPQEESK